MNLFMTVGRWPGVEWAESGALDSFRSASNHEAAHNKTHPVEHHAQLYTLYIYVHVYIYHCLSVIRHGGICHVRFIEPVPSCGLRTIPGSY